MSGIKRKYKRKLDYRDVCVFIAVLFSSMLGAQLFGLSLNKIALIPLEVMLIIKHGHRNILINSCQKNLVLFEVLFIWSSFFSLAYNYHFTGYNNGSIFNIFQALFIYIPLILLIQDCKNIKSVLLKCLISVGRIQAVWGIVQFLLWQILKIDFNQLFFVNFLHGAFGTNWNAWFYDDAAQIWAMRVTGLNHDPAYFALIIFLGFCFERSLFWKTVEFLAVILASSRSGIIVLTFSIVYSFIKRKKRINNIIIRRTILFITGAIIAFAVIYNNSPSIRYQISLGISRFMEISTASDRSSGTFRHMNYIPDAFNIWISDYSFIQKIFGIGPRSAGIALTMFGGYRNVLDGRAWVIECDPAELLLGNGIFALVLVYYIYVLSLKMNKNSKVKACLCGLMIFSVLYDVFETTLIQLFFIILAKDTEIDNCNRTSNHLWKKTETYNNTFI